MDDTLSVVTRGVGTNSVTGGARMGETTMPRSAHVTRRQLVGGAAAAAAASRLTRLDRVAAQESTPVAIPRAKSSATVDGTLQVLQKTDYHPDHNTFVRAEIEAYCAEQGWQVEISEVGGGQSSGEIGQRLVAGVQAGNAPDVYFDNIPVRQFQFLGVLEDVTDLTNEIIAANGDATPGFVTAGFFDDAWFGVPWFTRVDGWWARNDIFQPAGVDVTTLVDLNSRREAALAISDPANNRWGWGITVNRSGDGRAIATSVFLAHGSQIQDESGEKITFNSPESVAALEWFRETYATEKYAPMLPTGWGAWVDTSNNEAFLAGTLVLTQNGGTLYAKAVLDAVPFAKDIAYMPNPVRNSDGGTVDQLAGVFLHVIKDSKNKDAAYDLIRHLLTLPVQQRIWEISLAYAVPAYRNGWSDPLVTNTPNSMRAEPAVWNNTEFTGLRYPGPSSAALDAITGSWDQTDMIAEVLQGRSSEEVVAEYHDRWVQVYQDFGLPGE
jgi:multiple sugar transport system substrate-binding protein